MENERQNMSPGTGPQIRPRRPEMQNNSQLRLSDIFYAVKKHILLMAKNVSMRFFSVITAIV